MTITEQIKGLCDLTAEPGFPVGAGLRAALDSSGMGCGLVRGDGVIVLEWGRGGGMVGVTVSDLSPSEKRAITRVVRTIRPGFSPDWDMWRGMRRRALGYRMMLVMRPM